MNNENQESTNNLDKLHRYCKWMDSLRVQLIDFHQDKDLARIDRNFKPYRETLQVYDGIYLTMRCGLGGIYTCINEMKDGKWQYECLDASTTIAYRPLRDTEKFEYWDEHHS